MSGKKGTNTVKIAEELVMPLIDELGLTLWDVRYEKEGPSWYLRYFIDKPGGVNIQDCENLSKNIDPILDEKDPIPHSYTLEVSSPGVERELSKPWHYEQNIGEDINIRLIRPVEGKRSYTGKLVSYEDKTITLITEEELTMSFNENNTSRVNLHVNFEIGGSVR